MNTQHVVSVPHAYGTFENPHQRVFSPFEKMLVRFGLVASGNVARRVTALLALLTIVVAYVVLARALPDAHVLGDDTLRPGEVVPEYVSARQ